MSTDTEYARYYRISNLDVLAAFRKETIDTNAMLDAMVELGDKIDAKGAVTNIMRRLEPRAFKLNNWYTREDREAWCKPDKQGFSTLKVGKSGKWNDAAKRAHDFVKREMAVLCKEHPPVYEGAYLRVMGVSEHQIRYGSRTVYLEKSGTLVLAVKSEAPAEVEGVERLTVEQFEAIINAARKES